MAHEVARLIDGKIVAPEQFRRDASGPQLVEYKSNDTPDLAAAVDRLHAALNDMTPDDLSMTYTTEEANGKKRTSFQFRAYRR